MQNINNIIIPGSKEKPISLDLFYLANSVAKPVIVFVHGFKGFKDWGHFNLMAKKFAEAGFIFVKFNFSHNGTTMQNPTEFDDLEAFGNNNYIIELDDLKLVIDYVGTNNNLADEINNQQIYLLGHSRGGGISILKAAEDSRIKKLIVWASVCDFMNRNKQNTINEWKEKGVVFTFNSRTKQNMPLYYQLYETIANNKDRLDVTKAAGKLTMPFLIVHGTKDEAVSIIEAETLHRASKQSELAIIEGAGHTFEAKHPFIGETLPPNAQLVVEKSIDFFKK